MTGSQWLLLAIMMLTPLRRMALMARSLPAFAAGVLLLSLLSTTGGSAQSCTSNADCGNQALCISILFQGNQCIPFACASSAQCPPQLPTCVRAGASLGICTGSGGSSGTGSGGSSGVGISQSGEGGACGPRRFGGGVVKSIGCKRGLTCLNSRCQLLR